MVKGSHGRILATEMYDIVVTKRKGEWSAAGMEMQIPHVGRNFG